MSRTENILHRNFFFFNDTATTEIYTLSLLDALPISQPGPRSKPCQHALCLRVAGLRPELHAYRHTCRPDRDGRLSRHSAEALASTADYAFDRHHSCGAGDWDSGREQSDLVADSQPSDSEFSVAVRGDSADPIYWRSCQDGRIRQLAIYQRGCLGRCGCHLVLQR